MYLLHRSYCIKMETVGKVGTITYTLSRLRRCKNITVRVLGDGEVRVSAPFREPLGSVERVIRANQKKLEKTIAIQKAEHELYGHTWENGDSFLFHGEPHVLCFLSSTIDYLTRGDCVFNVFYVGTPPDKETLSYTLKELYRKSARMRIEVQLNLWAEKLNLDVPPFTIRDSKKRWGSCSSRGNLNFSLRSASLSDEELSYLVLHEMAHLVHFDHGPLFHAFLTLHMPNWKEHQQMIFSLQRRADLTP